MSLDHLSDQRRLRLLRVLEDMERRLAARDVLVPEYDGRLGTLMRWTPDLTAPAEDNECGVARIGQDLLCLRGVQSAVDHAVLCEVRFLDGSWLWVRADDVRWWGDITRVHHGGDNGGDDDAA